MLTEFSYFDEGSLCQILSGILNKVKSQQFTSFFNNQCYIGTGPQLCHLWGWNPHRGDCLWLDQLNKPRSWFDNGLDWQSQNADIVWKYKWLGWMATDQVIITQPGAKGYHDQTKPILNILLTGLTSLLIQHTSQDVVVWWSKGAHTYRLRFCTEKTPPENIKKSNR